MHQEKLVTLRDIGEVKFRRSKRAKRLRIVVSSAGGVVVTRPWRVGENQAVKFAQMSADEETWKEDGKKALSELVELETRNTASKKEV